MVIASPPLNLQLRNLAVRDGSYSTPGPIGKIDADLV